MRKNFTKSSFAGIVAFAAATLLSTTVNAANLTPQDAMVTTLYDKSIISGAIKHDEYGNLVFDKGNTIFAYSGTVNSIATKGNTGELSNIVQQIGTIEGEAAFPYSFVQMSAGINAVMNGYITMEQLLAPFGGMPPVVPWTCNHCKMTVGDSTFISIVDALDPITGNPDMIAKFNSSIAGGAAGAVAAMRLEGRAFMGETPVSFDPATKTMSLSMAGCSAVVGISGTHAGKMGTLCMNSTATFDVSGAQMDAQGRVVSSIITAKGSSNCTTVLHTPTM